MIPIEHPLPEGYEAVTFRVPKLGETFLTSEGVAYELKENSTLQHPRLILRKLWVWPSWLKCEYITRDGHGIYGWEGEPRLLGDHWVTPNPADPIRFFQIPEFVDLDLPPKQSIWRNPCFPSTKP